MNLPETLDNQDWVIANEYLIRDLFPDTWTHERNLDIFRISYGMQWVGIDLQTEDDMVPMMEALTQLKIIEVQGFLVRRNPHPQYDQKANRHEHIRRNT